MEKEITSKRAAEFGRIKVEELSRLVSRNLQFYNLLVKHTKDNDLREVMELVESVPFDRREYCETLTALSMEHDPPETPFFIVSYFFSK